MIQTIHDERRQQQLLTQREVAELAGCSVGRLQCHTRKGMLDLPSQRLGSRFFYSETQAREIKAYFRNRQRWDRINEHEDCG